MKQWMFSVAGAMLAIGLQAQDQKHPNGPETVDERLAVYQRELQLTDVQVKQVAILLGNDEPALQKLADQCRALQEEMRSLVMAQEEKINGMLSPEQAQRFKGMRGDGPAVFHAEGCTAAVVNGELRCCAGLHTKKMSNEEIAKEKAKAAAAAGTPQGDGLRDASDPNGGQDATPRRLQPGDNAPKKP